VNFGGKGGNRTLDPGIMSAGPWPPRRIGGARREEGRKAGHPFSQPDLIIAATGQHHGLTIVSRDTKEYDVARIDVFNPWTNSLPGMI